MAWLGEGLSSLSNLKGQITSFTKEVLSDGIVNEITEDERSKDLEEAKTKCSQLQELLNSKDAEISLLRRQNSELQKAVVEFRQKPADPKSINESQHRNDEEAGAGFFWDPPRSTRKQQSSSNDSATTTTETTKVLQDQLDQAAARIRDLEIELGRYRSLNSKDDANIIADNAAAATATAEGPSTQHKAEILRAKQDVVNRIIQIGEKGQEVERNAKRLHEDEQTLVADFRLAISKLASGEQQDLIKSALIALDAEQQQRDQQHPQEKSTTEASEKHEAGDDERLAGLSERVRELEEENRNLTTSIEELDRQNLESIERVLSLKDELQKKHNSLQSAYEQLYADYNQAQEKIDELKKWRSEAEVQLLQSSNVTTSSSSESKECQTTAAGVDVVVVGDTADKSVSAQPCSSDKDTQSVPEDRHRDEERQAREIIESAQIDLTEEEEDEERESKSSSSLLLRLARRCATLLARQAELERRYEEQSCELRETQEMRDGMQADCEDMQQNIESLLLETKRLKKCLPSIPEASEERVASLECETESLYEQLGQLRRANSRLAARLDSVRDLVKNDDVEGVLARIQELLAEEEEDSQQQLQQTPNPEDLEENAALRRRIEQLESELRSSLERCRGLDDNIELIEELKLDLENARREQKLASGNGKRLEHQLSQLQQLKNELDAENERLTLEKEKLEAALSESDERRADGEALAELREQLSKTSLERDDLEYDILQMRKELDRALEEAGISRGQIDKLRHDNERLARENNKLLDQFDDNQNESLDKIELLSTESGLLRQELESARELLEAAGKRATAAEENVVCLERLNKRLVEELTQLRDVDEPELRRRLQEASVECGELRERCQRLTKEVADLRAENERLAAEDSRHELMFEEQRTECQREEDELAVALTKLKCSESYASSLEDEHQLLQKRIAELEAKRAELEAAVAAAESQINEKQPSNATAASGGIDEEERQKLLKEIESLKSSLARDRDAAQMARETMNNLSQLISAKDSELIKLNASFDALRSERDELVRLVQDKHAESLQYHAEVQRLTQLLADQTANLQKSVAERDSLAQELAAKEQDALWLRNELQVLKQRLSNVEDASGSALERCGLAEHTLLERELEATREARAGLERSAQAAATEIGFLRQQLAEAQDKESLACKERDRLRDHLMEIEAGRTEEQLQTEEIQRGLEARLALAEEQLKNSSTMYTSASIRAQQQVETLQQQLALMAQQRDDLQNKISAAEDKVASYTASLTNLQLVLEQFQREREKDIHAATEKVRVELQESFNKQDALNKEIAHLKEQLNDARECLLAASRLSDQLDKKSERIEQLNQEVSRLNELVQTADERIQEAQRSCEGKVDRSLVKNLLMGYISSPANDKVSVLRVFANVLDFNEAEREKSGLNSASSKNSWFSSMINSGAAPTKEQESSLSSAFIQFLENESKPKPEMPVLPISTSPLDRPGHSRQHSSSSTQSTLLLSNINLPTFPEFVPARNTGSILKEVLKDS
ncbi:thyroid receptor-interacting protein 11-like [Trichogramma pretiosum]|uniref:thyroid receptor-interacting protein 11-like n=1 Tax=Trichogramma pretiosum TaxID=7493 RepID=UPI0006C96F25|nr:thyroid receptor-interacting protein 11-like [Trichogramma pretiosum]